jgi:hypothetical protein
VNTAVCPRPATVDEGCVVITGVVFTVSAADDDVTLPHVLLIKQSYEPASDTLAEAIVSVALVAPAMFEPFLRHWKVGDVPFAVTVNDADCPAHFVTAIG